MVSLTNLSTSLVRFISSLIGFRMGCCYYGYRHVEYSSTLVDIGQNLPNQWLTLIKHVNSFVMHTHTHHANVCLNLQSDMLQLIWITKALVNLRYLLSSELPD